MRLPKLSRLATAARPAVVAPIAVGLAAVVGISSAAVSATPDPHAIPAAPAPVTSSAPVSDETPLPEVPVESPEGFGSRQERIDRSQERTPQEPAPADALTAQVRKASGTMYTTARVNARAEASADSESVTLLDEGAKVSVTDRTSNDFREVLHDGKSVWVSSEYLSKDEPKEESSEPSPSSSSRSGSSSSSRSGSSGSGSAERNSTKSDGSGSGSGEAPAPSGGSCTVSTSIRSGLTSRARAVYEAVCARYSVKSYGGVRPGDSGDHGSGKALDIMISGPTGWDIANYLRANASSFGIDYIIYEQKIWSRDRSSEGWRGMSGRGGATANHYDHVHVSVQ